MDDVAGWIAPIATTLAAIMTAANLGSRITGIGFVVFLIGSIAWTAVGVATDQPNLLYQNLFLCAVNAMGIWRWLGRQARYDAGAEIAARRSEDAESKTLFPISRLAGGELRDRDGVVIGRTVDAMAACETGDIRYLVVSEGGAGGLGERLHAVPWRDVQGGVDCTGTRLSIEDLEALPEISADAWPGRVPEHG